MSAIRTEDIDAALLDIAGPMLFGQKTKTAKGSIGAPLAGQRAPAPARLVGVGSPAIRRKLQALVAGAPEVMVKISGAPTGMRQVRAHLNYISRHGELELEDQGEERHLGRDALAEVGEGFEQDGYPIPEQGRVRQGFNIVLSMPQGTDVVGLKRAARAFAATEFEGFSYVMALHTYETDPDPQPSPHPHVHLAVKAKSSTGVRLNPRKADLQRWRETFVQTLADNGIEAVATRRAVRLQRQPGARQSVQQLKNRGGQPSRLVRRDDAEARRKGALDSDATVTERYRGIAAILRESPDSKDWRLALGLLERFVGGREQASGVEKLRDGPDQPRRDRDPER